MLIGRIPVELNLLLERTDNRRVPWEVVDDQCDYPEEYRGWCDNLALFEMELWPLPDYPPSIKPGQRIFVRGPATILCEELDTYFGREYNEDLTWEVGAVTATIAEAEEC